MIAVVIDISQRLDKFSDSGMTTAQVAKYYLCFIPYINGLLWPLFALIAVIFFTSRMARDAEIISILNAGVSYTRMAVPYLISGLFITMLLLYANHFLIPQSNKIRFDYDFYYLNKVEDSGKDRDVLLQINPGVVAYVRSYNKRDSLARDVRIEIYDGNQLKEIFKAKEMKWLEPPNRWTMIGYELRKINGTDEFILVERGSEVDTAINVYPSDFYAFKNEMEIMTSPQLLAYIGELEYKGTGNVRRFIVEYYRRTSEPVTVVILTIIGLSVASRKVRGGMGLHLAIGVILGAMFIFLSKISITFSAQESLPPFIGVWIPNTVFFFIALFLMNKAQK
jgi:lipopolysaccharide export system permease protein